MGTFICKCTCMALFVAFILSICIGTEVCLARSFHWELPKEKTVLFMGASHINHGIKAGLTDSAVNYAKDSERYMYTYLKLKNLLKENSQINTVFLEFAPTDIWEHTDDKYYNDSECSEFLPVFHPFFSKVEWMVYKGEFERTARFILSNLYKNIKWTLKKDGYAVALGYGDKPDGQNSRIFSPDEVSDSSPVTGVHGCGINYTYLRMIIDLCALQNCRLYFLYCPVYRPELFYNQEQYYLSYEQYFSDVELLDYSAWDASPEERYDAHHLNCHGAERFTRELMERFNIN